MSLCSKSKSRLCFNFQGEARATARKKHHERDSLEKKNTIHMCLSSNGGRPDFTHIFQCIQIICTSLLRLREASSLPPLCSKRSKGKRERKRSHSRILTKLPILQETTRTQQLSTAPAPGQNRHVLLPIAVPPRPRPPGRHRPVAAAAAAPLRVLDGAAPRHQLRLLPRARHQRDAERHAVRPAHARRQRDHRVARLRGDLVRLADVGRDDEGVGAGEGGVDAVVAGGALDEGEGLPVGGVALALRGERGQEAVLAAVEGRDAEGPGVAAGGAVVVVVVSVDWGVSILSTVGGKGGGRGGAVYCTMSSRLRMGVFSSSER